MGRSQNISDPYGASTSSASAELFAKLPLSVLRRKDVSDGAKLVYARLMLYAEGSGVAYPSQGTLAAEVGKSRRAVQYLLDELVGMNLIVSERGQRGCRYQLGRLQQVSDAQETAHAAARSDVQEPSHQEVSRCAIPSIQMRNLAYPDAQPTAHNQIRRDQEDNQSLHQSSCSRKQGADDGPKDTVWFSDSNVTYWRTQFRDARRELPSIPAVEHFLGAFRDAVEAVAYNEYRWPMIQHSALRHVSGYRTDAETWVKQYRDDLAAGRADLYIRKPSDIANSMPKPELIDPERLAALAAEHAARERERETSRLQAIRARAAAGDVAARLVEHINAKGGQTPAEEFLEVALESASGRVEGEALVLAGVVGGALAFKPSAVLDLLPCIGINGVSRVRFVERGEVAA